MSRKEMEEMIEFLDKHIENFKNWKHNVSETTQHKNYQISKVLNLVKSKFLSLFSENYQSNEFLEIIERQSKIYQKLKDESEPLSADQAGYKEVVHVLGLLGQEYLQTHQPKQVDWEKVGKVIGNYLADYDVLYCGSSVDPSQIAEEIIEALKDEL
jgi:hypothetical protein